MKISDKKGTLKLIRAGVRLSVKPPKRETPKTIYNRKSKKGGIKNETSFFLSNSSLINLYDRQKSGSLHNNKK